MADCTLAARRSVERIDDAGDLRPRPPPLRSSETLAITRDWRALPGTPVRWRGPPAQEVLVAGAHTVLAVSHDCVVALAIDDGTIRWSAERPRIGDFRGHVLAGDGRVVIGRAGGLVARDAITGVVVWELELAREEAWLDHPVIDGALLTMQVEQRGTVSRWHVDLESGRVVRREPCEGHCRTSESSVAVRSASDADWEGYDPRTGVVLWRRTLGSGVVLATVESASLILAGAAVHRIAHADGQSTWRVRLPEDARLRWTPSVLAGDTLFFVVGPILVGLDARDGSLRALQTLEDGAQSLGAVDERIAIARDVHDRIAILDLEHVVASPRETLSLGEDIAQLARVLAASRDVFLDRRAREAIDFIARVESSETAPAIAAALSSLPIVPASQLARALGSSREPEVQQALLALLEPPTEAPRSALERQAREIVARAIEFPLDTETASRLASALIAAARASRESGMAPRLPLRAIRDLIERTAPTAQTLDDVRHALGLDHPRCELPELEAIELAAARHFVELGSPGALATSSRFCGELRSLHGPVSVDRHAVCGITVEREPRAPAHGLWSNAPSARATLGCRGSTRVVRLRFVDGAWRVTDDLGGIDF